MSEEAKKGVLLDFDDEEEDDDSGAAFESAQPVSASSEQPSASQNSAPKSDGLLDYDEEEDESSDGAEALLKEKKKKKKLRQESDDDEDEEDFVEEEKESPKARDKRKPRVRVEEPEQENDMPSSDSTPSDNEDLSSVDIEEEHISNLMLPSLENVRPNLSSRLYHVQLPRFLYIAGGAFDEDAYDFDKEREQIKARNGEELVGDEIIRWRVKRDKHGNVMFDEKKQPLLESNARIVEYEDGTFQIFVGEEALDLKITSTLNEFIHARVIEGEDRKAFSGLAGFQGMGVIVPTGPESKQHRALQAAIKRQQVRTVAMKSVVTTVDPQQELEKKIKEFDQQYRKSVRRTRSTGSKRKRGAVDDDDEDRKPRSKSRKREVEEEEDDFIVDDDEEEEEEEELGEDEESAIEDESD